MAAAIVDVDLKSGAGNTTGDCTIVWDDRMMADGAS
jgi:hypothetical protein